VNFVFFPHAVCNLSSLQYVIYTCNNLFELIAKCVALTVLNLIHNVTTCLVEFFCAKDHFPILQLLVLVRVRFKSEKS